MAKRCYFEYSIGKVQCSNYTHKKFSIVLLFHTILLWIASCNVWIWNLQQTVCGRLGTCCGNLWSETRYRTWYREPDGFSKVPTRCPLTHLHFGIFAKDEHFLICIQQGPEKILNCWIHVFIFTDFCSQKPILIILDYQNCWILNCGYFPRVKISILTIFEKTEFINRVKIDMRNCQILVFKMLPKFWVDFCYNRQLIF